MLRGVCEPEGTEGKDASSRGVSPAPDFLGGAIGAPRLFRGDDATGGATTGEGGLLDGTTGVNGRSLLVIFNTLSLMLLLLLLLLLLVVVAGWFSVSIDKGIILVD
jgi:hypothetical protein